MRPSAKLKELIANRIILRSPKGKTRAWFDASSEEVVSLNLYGPKASLSLCPTQIPVALALSVV
jgi:hypothetical protein